MSRADAGERQADLRLDTFEGAIAEVIVPGAPDESELIARIHSLDPDERMPPPEAKISLSAGEKDLLERWIAAGAEYAEHWSFVAPEKLVLSGDGHPLDELVALELRHRGMELAPEAEREVLVRRVFLDLTGLPPRPEEVAAFINDDQPAAYERLVDRLLASPAYGERMAWDWLDASRYADSNGYQGDNERTMWPWRDWVVRAFNENMPYDQFTIWQLAGDLLPQGGEEAEARDWVLPQPPDQWRGRTHRGREPGRLCDGYDRDDGDGLARVDAELLPLPRSQIRSLGTERLLPVHRLF